MRERVLSLGGVAALCALAWAYLLTEASSMQGMPEMPGMEDMSGMSAMAGMGGTWDPTELGYLCVMWSIMMVAMMLPSALPTLLLVARIDRTRAARGSGGDARRAALGVTPPFVAGYLAAWSAYSILAATVQWTLHGLLLVSPAMVSVSPLLSGGILIAAGIYQFTPLKNRCIAHCRSPLSFLTSHWREGAGGALRMGLRHGTYCVGCCWALMALLFVLGVMNLLWVTALAALVLVEKALPGGRWVTWGAGAVLLAWGIVVVLGPSAGVL